MAAGAAGLRSVSGPARGSLIAVGAGAALGMIGSIVQYADVDTAKDYLAGRISESEFEDSVAASTAITSVSGLAQIAAIVFTLIWMYRVLANHRAVLRQTTWGPGWGIGGWFLPPFLFVIPMLALREAWQASSPDVPAGEQRWKQAPISPVVWVWWALYGVLPLAFIPITFARLGGFSTETEDLAEMVKDTAGLGIAQSVVSLGAAAAWIVLVRQLTSRHEQLIGLNR
jgi:hypothetical protein